MKINLTEVGASLMFLGLIVVGVCHQQWLSDQHSQIDQLSQMTVTLARTQGAADGYGFTMGKEYCFFFADYARCIAVVGEFDGEIHYNKKPRLVILHNVKEELLRSWEKSELCYGYKKIR